MPSWMKDVGRFNNEAIDDVDELVLDWMDDVDEMIKNDSSFTLSMRGNQ